MSKWGARRVKFPEAYAFKPSRSFFFSCPNRSLHRNPRIPAKTRPSNGFRHARCSTIGSLMAANSYSVRFSGSSSSANGGGAGFSSISNGGAEENGLVRFVLSPTCLLNLQQGDITKWSVNGTTDAIVNAANELMLRGGGVDGAIHRAAGPELRAACRDVPVVQPGVRCPTGEARITPAFRLPVSHIIHTVGPIYGTDADPEASLRSAFRNSLRVAKENNIQFIAFPAISCGVYHYPIKEASRIAISTVREFANGFKEETDHNSFCGP